MRSLGKLALGQNAFGFKRIGESVETRHDIAANFGVDLHECPPQWVDPEDNVARELPYRSERLVSCLVRFSRRGETSPYGKVGQTLGQLRLCEETEPLVRAAAAKARMPLMEFVRRYFELGFHGRDEVEHRNKITLDGIESVLPKRNSTTK